MTQSGDARGLSKDAAHAIQNLLVQITFTRRGRHLDVPIGALQSLDLVQRLPHSQHALLLRFGSASPSCHRHCDLRVGYAFCPICIAEHPIVHVPWDWCLACLVCCSVHGTSLQLGCHSCGEPDPISFVVPPTHACWSCGADLTSGPRSQPRWRRDGKELAGLLCFLQKETVHKGLKGG